MKLRYCAEWHYRNYNTSETSFIIIEVITGANIYCQYPLKELTALLISKSLFIVHLNFILVSTESQIILFMFASTQIVKS